MTEKPETYGFPEDMWNEMDDETKKYHMEYHERTKNRLKNDIMNDFHITEHDWNSMRPAIKKLVQYLYGEILEFDGIISEFRDWYARVPI